MLGKLDHYRFSTFFDGALQRPSLLQPVFRNGEILIDEHFSTIREREHNYNAFNPHV